MIDSHKTVPEPTEEVLQLIRDKMYAFIFPNDPRTDEDKQVFEKAVRYQYAHEATAAMSMSDVPQGVHSFSIGDFSMSFEDGLNDMQLTRKTICPSAYGMLLRHGLLYRGVERCGGCGVD